MITVNPLRCKSTAVGYNTGNYAKAEKNVFIGYECGWRTRNSNNILIGVELDSKKDNQIKIGNDQVGVKVGVYNLEDMWKYMRELEERVQELESERSRSIKNNLSPDGYSHPPLSSDPLNTHPV